jgi:hypothetical protein
MGLSRGVKPVGAIGLVDHLVMNFGLTIKTADCKQVITLSENPKSIRKK